VLRVDAHPHSAHVTTGEGECGCREGRGAGLEGRSVCTQSGRTPTPRTGVLDGFDKQHHYDEASCGWFHCRRNAPANRDPGGSPEQQDYVLRVDTHPHSAHFIRGGGRVGV
jgi:hypothetical protein